MAIASVMGSTDVLTPLAPGVPAMGRIGLLVATFAFALVTLRFDWADTPKRVRRMTYAIVAAGIALLVYLAVFALADAMATALVLGTLTASVALILASRRWQIDAARRKDRAAQLASLGRFSAQLSHDIKNPLAALKGATQLLRDDVAQLGATRAGPAPGELVELMLGEIARVERVVDVYGRLARVEVVPTAVDLNAIAREAVKAHALAHGDRVKLEMKLADPLPSFQGDPDLLAAVLDNLVRNGAEAIDGSGTITVRTERAARRVRRREHAAERAAPSVEVEREVERDRRGERRDRVIDERPRLVAGRSVEERARAPCGDARAEPSEEPADRRALRAREREEGERELRGAREEVDPERGRHRLATWIVRRLS
jgi:signal transduction histidine kinase